MAFQSQELEGGGMPFATFSLDELGPGVLLQAFVTGKSAAIIECGDFVETLWSMLLEDPHEKLPWELPLVDLARNHVRGKDLPSTLGDVFYFQPGHHSYIARKLEISPLDGQVSPSKFRQGDEEVSPSPEVVNLCCSFVDKIMMAISPPGKPIPKYKVAVQRLKYQADWGDYQALTELVEDSLARWGRKGYVLDVLRSQVAGPFSLKGISDLMALVMMMTRRREAMNKKSKIAGNDHEGSNSPARIYEHSHTDFRFFTALCGSRSNVRTEVLVDGKWLELPVNLNAIAIYPGTIGLKGTSIEPTTHRVVHRISHEESCGRASNVTVVLGAV
jgi:hypothetical protein